MSIYQLENEAISISVDSRGAELKSLKRKDSGTEYMWCADGRYWNRTSRRQHQKQGIPHQGQDLFHDPARLRQGYGVLSALSDRG